MAKSKKVKFSLPKMIDYILGLIWFDPDDPFLKVNYEPGHKSTRLLLCTGDNATGKSFFARMVSAYCKIESGLNDKAECLRVGMELRATSGIHQAFILQGMENEESTGVNSIHMVEGVMRNAKNREHCNIVVIDEPDIGLAESYSRAMGLYLAQEIRELSKLTKLVVIVSHSRALLEPLLAFRPAHIRFGDDMKLEEWLEKGPPQRSIEELLALPNHSRDIWRSIRKELRD